MSEDTARTHHRNAPHQVSRVSCAWTDALGPGFASGPSQGLLDLVAGQDQRGYCPR